MQDTLNQRRQMEADVIQVDLWYKDADENLCSKPIPLEGSIDEIHAAFKKYQVCMGEIEKVHSLFRIVLLAQVKCIAVKLHKLQFNDSQTIIMW